MEGMSPLQMAGESSNAEEHGTVDTLFANIKTMDNLLIERTADVFRYYHRNKPVTLQSLQGDIHSLRMYRDYNIRDSQSKISYIQKLPQQFAMWQKTTHLILDWAGLSGPGLPSKSSWALWAETVYEAGKEVVSEASISFQSIREAIGPGGFVSINERLKQIDKLLGKLPGNYGEKLSEQFEDNMLAITRIKEQGGDITKENIDYFKSELRARKATIGATSSFLPRSDPIENDHDRSPQGVLTDDPWKPTIFAVTMIIIAVSFSLVILGWQASPHEPGTTADADFWFLLQGMLMQTASIVPLALGLWTKPKQNRQVSVWIWIFIGISIACTLIAPILYLMVPTEWSAFIAFFGSVGLAFVILEAMLVPSVTGKKTI